VHTSRTTTPKNGLRPMLEALEGREMMSVTAVTLSAGTLHVVADGGNDYVEIRQMIGRTGPGQTVTVRDKTATANNVWAFNASGVQRIVVETNGGNDRVDSNAVAPTQVWGGEGADLIVTGGGKDEIIAGGGNDTVFAGGGNDTVSGHGGDDLLAGGAGNDSLYGHGGTNRLLGDSGNDSLFAGSRSDTVDGGVGYDYLDLFAGQHVAVNGESTRIGVPQGQPQTDGWSCGPNSGSRFLRSYGINVSYNTLRSQVQENNAVSKFHLGTLPATLRNVLSNHKSDVSLERGASRDRVLQLLGQGKPVIALVAVKKVDIEKFGIKVGTYGLLHYVVLNGYDQASETIRYVDTDGTAKTWTFSQFSKRSNWVDYFTGIPGNAMQESLRALGMRNQTIIF
jgi:Ca2+-binding RTX toxin-like protein